MFWRALSLRSKLFILALASLVLMSGFAFLQGNHAYQSRRSEIKSDFVAHAIGTARGIASSFFERYTDIHAFSLNSVFQGGQKEQITQVLNGLVTGYQVYDVIMFVDKNGQFVATNTKSADGRALDTKVMEGRAFADTPWFQRAARNEFTEDKQRGFSGSVVEDLQIDPISSALYGSTQYGVSFTRPVVGADGQLVGVLTARTSLRFVESELRSAFETLRMSGAGSAQILLINKDGLIAAEVSADVLAEKGEVKRNSDRILRWNVATQQGQLAAQEAIVGRSGSLIELDRIGRTERLWGFYPMRDLRFPDQMNWSVIVSARSDEVLGDVFSQRQIFSVVLAGLVVLLALLGYGASRSISRDYLELSVRLKDETHRLIEVSDELSDIAGKSDTEEKPEVAALVELAQKGRELGLQTEDRWSAINESVNALRDVTSAMSVGLHSSEQVSDELKSINSQLGLLGQSGVVLSAVQAKLTALNEIVFRAQLIGFNLTIETNRSQSGKAFNNIAQEVVGLAEQTEQIARELAETLLRAQRQLSESERLTRERVVQSERLMNEWVNSLNKIHSGLPTITDALSASAESVQQSDTAMKTLTAAIETVSESLGHMSSGHGDLSRYVHEVRDQSYRIDDLAQEFASTVKGGRARTRGKRHSQGAFFQSFTRTSSDRARADAVDRLAQKMRPRLVVKADDHEPEVTELSASVDPTRRAG